MDTYKALRDELGRLKGVIADRMIENTKSIVLLERAIENKESERREPKPGEVWELPSGTEVLIVEPRPNNNDCVRMIELDTFKEEVCHRAYLGAYTFRRMFNEDA